MMQVDTILNCRFVIPIEPQNVVYENYAIILSQGKILDLLTQKEAGQKYTSCKVIHLDQHAVLPGFVNAHTHSPMVLFRGMADDLPLMEWLNNHIWPAEARWLSEEFIYDGTKLAIAEMIRSGTTCFNEHFFFPDAIISAIEETKLRACVGPTIINFANNWSQNENDALAKFEAIFKTFHRKNPLLTIALAPHAPYTTTDVILKKIAAFSLENKVPIHMHVQETRQEVENSLEKFAKRPLQRLNDLGLLSPRFQAVHMTQMNEQDLNLLIHTKATLTHCPKSNLKLASGYCPTNKLLQHNINVALGTDGAASNNNLDMIEEIRTAALLGKAVAESATALNAAQALKMATLNGAKALGLEDQIGSIEVGKSADIIAINLNHINTQPLYHPVSQIVYAANSQQVTDVWVAGNQLMTKQQLNFLQEEELLSCARKWQKRLRDKQ